MSTAVRVDLEPGLSNVVRPAALSVPGLAIREADAALDGPLRAATGTARASGAAQAAVIAAVRSMYKQVGLDPTRTRPSSEALLRRVRKGGALPRINAAVDVINWTSLETQLPFGLYDRARIRGDVALRLGREGEEYPGIRKDVVHVAGRLALVDEDGPFGNPTSDSARTMVTTSTGQVLVVVFAPFTLEPAVGAGACQLAADRLSKFCGL